MRRTTVGDDADEIARAVREALDRTGAVITTGGLGPTSDDLTQAVHRRAVRPRACVSTRSISPGWSERWRKRFNRPMPAANRQQAMIPDGATKLANNHGSAPGIWLEDERGRWVAMLPGVPREMRGMLADTLLPLLRVARRRRAPSCARARCARPASPSRCSPTSIESMDGGPLGAVARLSAVDRRASTCASPCATSRADDADARSSTAADAAARAGRRRRSTARATPTSPRSCSTLCRARGLTIGVAESCTGGLLGARLTAIPGSSDVVLGGVIAYRNDVKRDAARRDARRCSREHGAVSEQVVRQMAAGARRVDWREHRAGDHRRRRAGRRDAREAGRHGLDRGRHRGRRSSARLLRLWGDRDEIRQRVGAVDARAAAHDALRRCADADPSG